jgi:hypothetical protein
MEHKIINTGDYLLIIDESEIKEGDWIKPNAYNTIIKATKVHTTEFVRSGVLNDCKKIIAHLPLNNSPILEGVILLPPLEDEVEIPMRNQTIDYSYGYRQGYNKAKEKYKYTEEDLMKAIDMAREYTPDVVGFTKDEIIQSIQKPKMPIGFMCEVEYVGGDIEESDDYDERDWEQKTITNSQGIIQWVGEYIY